MELPWRKAKPSGDEDEEPALLGDAIVTEGRLVEVPTQGATGMERRAFGEFESPRGELASYAIGWRSDADPWVGRITVGIGAGNPGGATVHAIVFPHEDGHAFQLVDEPLTEVPEGGPHVTADQARALRDLPFIWAVADLAMERDRRAWWMRHWLLETWALSTGPVFRREEPVLLVGHHEDGTWTLVGTSDADADDATSGHLFHAVDEDQTLLDVLDLAPGRRAVRDTPGGPWTREPVPPDDDV